MLLEQMLFKERSIMITDATKKGVENMLHNFRRGLVTSSELANTVLVEGFSDQAAGLHFASKARLCQHTQSETIATATGQGQLTLSNNSYGFAAKLLGQ
jgi:hypothetical protein